MAASKDNQTVRIIILLIIYIGTFIIITFDTMEMVAVHSDIYNISCVVTHPNPYGLVNFKDYVFIIAAFDYICLIPIVLALTYILCQVTNYYDKSILLMISIFNTCLMIICVGFRFAEILCLDRSCLTNYIISNTVIIFIIKMMVVVFIDVGLFIPYYDDGDVK